MATREIRIDRSKTLAEEPGTGHNRWHPDIAPVIRCQPGDEVILETRDAFDGQMGPGASLDTVAAPNLDVVHPLTGPVYVEGAEPGDVLDVEILEVEPDRYGYTMQVPGFGFLSDVFAEPFKVSWASRAAGPPPPTCPESAFPAPRSWELSACRPDTSCWPPPPPASRRCWTAAGSCCRHCPRPPSPMTRGWQRRDCAPCRPGSRQATSTSRARQGRAPAHPG